MSVVFPNNNLPTSSQPWAREVQKQLSNIILSDSADAINNAARDNQLNSSIIALTGVVNKVNAALVSIGLLEGNIYYDGTTEIDGANIRVGTLSASSITTGTLTGVTIQSAASGQRVVISGTEIQLYNSSNQLSGLISGESASGLATLVINNGSEIFMRNNYFEATSGSGSLLLSGSVASLSAGTGQASIEGDSSVSISTLGTVFIQGTVSFSGSNISMPNITSDTSAANVRWGAGGGGRLFYIPSARKYKLDIQDGTANLEALNLRPRTWIDKGQYERNGNSAEGLYRVPGFVAEEVLEAGLEEFVTYDENGEIQGLSYERMTAALIPVLQYHQQKIQELTDKIQTLENGA